MRFAGIDPGKTGGLALLPTEEETLHCCYPMPVIKPGRTRAGKVKGRPEYDLLRIASILEGWNIHRDLFVTVEKPAPLPPVKRNALGQEEKAFSGSVANFQRGVQLGFSWMLIALKIPHQLVAPITWQKVMHAQTSGRDTKQRSLVAAQRLFPGVDMRVSQRATKPNIGIVEAFLIADYGRRFHEG